MNRSSHRHTLDPLHCTFTAGPSVIPVIYLFQNNGEEQQEQLYSAFYLQNSNKIRVACTFQTANNLIFNVVAAKWSWFWWLSIKLVCFIDHTSYAALWTINRSTFWCHLCHIYTTGTSTCVTIAVKIKVAIFPSEVWWESRLTWRSGQTQKLWQRLVFVFPPNVPPKRNKSPLISPFKGKWKL